MTKASTSLNGFKPKELARKAHLRHVQDDCPGISRRRAGNGFKYINSSGKRIRKSQILKRIEALAIPPAWRDVWICRWPNGHLQATGKDDRNRKQYLYHPKWSEAVARAKFKRLADVGRLLPLIRRRARKDFQRRGHDKSKVLAGMVQLLDATFIRAGNEEYTTENGSYGLTTLRNEHVKINGRTIDVDFVGKGGQRRHIHLMDPPLARFLKACRENGRGRLFHFQTPEGELCEANSAALNEYLKQIASTPVTAKDFRTWKATAVVAEYLYRHRDAKTKSVRKRIAFAAIDEAAELLGNTRSICRSHYVHPALIDCYIAGEFASAVKGLQVRRQKWLNKDEQIALHVLGKLARSRPKF